MSEKEGREMKPIPWEEWSHPKFGRTADDLEYCLRHINSDLEKLSHSVLDDRVRLIQRCRDVVELTREE